MKNRWEKDWLRKTTTSMKENAAAAKAKDESN
jgi:hypothetical protein